MTVKQLSDTARESSHSHRDVRPMHEPLQGVGDVPQRMAGDAGACVTGKAASEVNVELELEMGKLESQVPTHFLPNRQQSHDLWRALEARVTLSSTPWQRFVRRSKSPRGWVYGVGGALVIGLGLTAAFRTHTAEFTSAPAAVSEGEARSATQAEWRPLDYQAMSKPSEASATSPRVASKLRVSNVDRNLKVGMRQDTRTGRTRALPPAHTPKGTSMDVAIDESSVPTRSEKLSVAPSSAGHEVTGMARNSAAEPRPPGRTRAVTSAVEDEAAVRRDLKRLQRATASLRGGRYEEALIALKRDPVEVLRTEATSLMAESLCRLGSGIDGRALLAGSTSGPTSLSAARACALKAD